MMLVGRSPEWLPVIHPPLAGRNLLARYLRPNEQELARPIDVFPALPPIDKAEIAATERLSGTLVVLSRSQRAAPVARRAAPASLPPRGGGHRAVLAILQPRMIC